MFTSFLYIWLFSVLTGHFVAVWLDKQETIDALLRTYIDFSLYGIIEAGRLISLGVHYIGRTALVTSEYLGSIIEEVMNYIGASIMATLVFSGTVISESINFTGKTISSALQLAGGVLSHSVDFAGRSVSSTILFIIDVMEKMASMKVLYTFLFVLSFYLMWKSPETIQNGLQSILCPMRGAVVEVWRVSVRAIFLVWSSMNLFDMLKFLLVVAVMMHIKNNIFC